MLVLYILLSILLLIFTALLIPVKLLVTFNETFEITVKYLWLRFPIDLSANDSKPPDKKVLEKESADKKDKTDEKSGIIKVQELIRRKGFWGLVETLVDVAKILATASKRILSQIKVKSFDFYLCLGGEDAAETAVLYGKVCGIVYPAFSALFSAVDCKLKFITVDLDYKQKSSTACFKGKVQMRPIFLLAAGVSTLWKLVPFIKELRSGRASPPNRKSKESPENDFQKELKTS